jgi:hypothetical protein
MRYPKQQPIAGVWVKGAEVVAGTHCKLVSETSRVPSQFKDEKTGETKFQDVAKVQVSGDTEPKNISLNRATIYGLVDAFGEESADWMGHVLTMQTEKVIVGGRRVTAVYLIPDGYELTEDNNGYTVIVRKGTAAAAPEELPSIDF